MTYAPASLKAAQTYLKGQTGLPWVSLGIVGDEDHHGGYHQGKPNVPATDYSRDESARDEKGLTGAASALDIGDFSRLRALSLWIVEQCKAGAADTRDIREVIYSPDGKTVKRWDRLGIRSSGDSSHLKHTHISYFRDSENREKTGLFRRYFEGGAAPSLEGAPAPTLRENDEGPAVGQLQKSLNEALGLNLVVDEGYGPATTAAVRELQSRTGITEDGIYGQDSADALRDLLEDDMSWDEKIALVTGQGVSYSGTEWPAGFLLASTNYYTLKRTQEIIAEQKASRLREEAILAAVKGLDTKAVINAVNAAAAADSARDAALLAELQNLAGGGATAQEIVDQLALRLAGGE
jgi:peptidoglycan hydrolase-like protein with peptidoglycan-binding domain